MHCKYKKVQRDIAHTHTHTHRGGGGGGVLYADLKRWVFKACLKEDVDTESRTSYGNEFHSVGARERKSSLSKGLCFCEKNLGNPMVPDTIGFNHVQLWSWSNPKCCLGFTTLDLCMHDIRACAHINWQMTSEEVNGVGFVFGRILFWNNIVTLYPQMAVNVSLRVKDVHANTSARNWTVAFWTPNLSEKLINVYFHRDDARGTRTLKYIYIWPKSERTGTDFVL